MPSSLPSSRIRFPVSSAAFAAEPLLRSIGTWPAPDMNARLNQPLKPRPVKYSCLARKVTRRRTRSGMKIESENDRWLLAMIAAPLAGTCSSPSTYGRKISRSQGPRSAYFNSQ